MLRETLAISARRYGAVLGAVSSPGAVRLIPRGSCTREKEWLD